MQWEITFRTKRPELLETFVRTYLETVQHGDMEYLTLEIIDHGE